jgi:hypothetical protein
LVKIGFEHKTKIMIKKLSILVAILIVSSLQNKAYSQINEDQIGAWYMYFFSTDLKDKGFGVQGDIQYRNWNLGGDLEQLLLRGGLTYKPQNANVKFTLGYGNITTGEFGSGTSTIAESRIYQEALLPHKINNWVYLTHRFRYEQRFVENQDFRTRYRYNLFMNVSFTGKPIVAKSLYLALYNELFINGERAIGNGSTVQTFDRNRFYAALGYCITDDLKVQLGIMRQTTNSWDKRQLQVSCHHKF